MNEYYSRWYDKDPVLSMSMRTLANSDDASQIAVALNLIKVIIEHNINNNEFSNIEDIVGAVEDGLIQKGTNRWYDLDATVRTAIQMLERFDEATRQKVALDMAQLVIEKIVQDADIPADSDEDAIEGSILDLDAADNQDVNL